LDGIGAVQADRAGYQRDQIPSQKHPSDANQQAWKKRPMGPSLKHYPAQRAYLQVKDFSDAEAGLYPALRPRRNHPFPYSDEGLAGISGPFITPP